MCRSSSSVCPSTKLKIFGSLSKLNNFVILEITDFCNFRKLHNFLIFQNCIILETLIVKIIKFLKFANVT